MGQCYRVGDFSRRRAHPHFETLDAKIATALTRIIQSSNFKKEIYLEEQNDQNEDRYDKLRKESVFPSDWYSRVHP